MDYRTFLLAFPLPMPAAAEPPSPPPLPPAAKVERVVETRVEHVDRWRDRNIYVMDDCNGKAWSHENPAWLRKWVAMQKPARRDPEPEPIRYRELPPVVIPSVTPTLMLPSIGQSSCSSGFCPR